MRFFSLVFGKRHAGQRQSEGAEPEALPSFGEPRREPSLAQSRRPDRLVTPAKAFTPTQPRHGRRQLIGRQPELARILQALQDDRAHVVLYAERGRGKTSLTNMVVEALRQSDVVVARHTCDADSDFDRILRGLMRDLPASLMAAEEVRAHTEGCEQALPERDLRPGDLVALPGRLVCRSLVCVIDEFDRVKDPSTRTRIADSIKQLSDSNADLRFLIVGVSENLDQILGQHPSIQRNVLGVHLPLFTDRDVALLVAKGARETGFSFSATMVARIASLARGSPHMAHLVALRLAQAAAIRGDTCVVDADLDSTLGRLLDDTNPSVLVLYGELTGHGQNGAMIAALREVAMAEQDPWGRMTVLPSAYDTVTVGLRPIPIACWARLQEAQVLKPYGTSTGLFVVADRGLMNHVLMLSARDSFLKEQHPPCVSAPPPAVTPGSIGSEPVIAGGPMLHSVSSHAFAPRI